MDAKIIFILVYLVMGLITYGVFTELKSTKVYRWIIWMPFWGAMIPHQEIRKIHPEIHIQQYFMLYQIIISILIFITYYFI